MIKMYTKIDRSIRLNDIKTEVVDFVLELANSLILVVSMCGILW